MTDFHGLVACGHPLTAEIAVEVLRGGGNAVDAIVAAAFASCVCETPLTGIAGGGFMMIDHPERGSELLDFFVAAPGLGLGPATPTALHFEDVVIDFGPTTQIFHIGLGSVAVPGNPSGFVTAHQRWGRLPLADLLRPAIRLAEEGVTLTEWSEITFRVLEPIITYSPEIAAIFAPGGRLLREGDRFQNPELADVLRAIARDGSDGFYRGTIGDAIRDAVNYGGGRMTDEDLQSYHTIVREPLVMSYRGNRVLLNPPPSLGGILIALSLHFLSHTPLGGLGYRTPEALLALQRAMDVTNFVRLNYFPQTEVPEHFYKSISSVEQLSAFLDHYVRSSAGNTTHISVVDEEGLTASCTNSYGEGCGSLVPGTGIELNNMLGEEDLNPHGFHKHLAGSRLPSMMCPLIVDVGQGGRVAMGSGGSNRIRTALLQAIVHLVDLDMPLAEAINSPRVHWENGIFHAEPGETWAAFEQLERAGFAVKRWPERNLFFGGVHAAYRHRSGRLEGAGDPRRYGVVRRA